MCVRVCSWSGGVGGSVRACVCHSGGVAWGGGALTSLLLSHEGYK